MPIDCRTPDIRWITEAMERLAPESWAEAWDNVGLLIGDRAQPVRRVLVALDFTEQVAQEAVALNAGLVITHHPFLFKPIQSVTADSAIGRRIIFAIRNQIAVYAAHTNLDVAVGGANDILFERLGLSGKENLEDTDTAHALGRVGQLHDEATLGELAMLVADRLCLDGVRYVGDAGRAIKRVGICTGSASEAKYFIWAVKKGCDAYITGDVKYHDAQAAEEMGLALIDATHFGGEVIAVEHIRQYLAAEAQKGGKDLLVSVSKTESDAIKNIRCRIT